MPKKLTPRAPPLSCLPGIVHMCCLCVCERECVADGGPEGVLKVERYALATGPVGGMAMHAVPHKLLYM